MSEANGGRADKCHNTILKSEQGTVQSIWAPSKRPKRGGTNHLQRLLGMRQDNLLPTDVVIVSLDLEVSEDLGNLHLLERDPVIRQVGFATLDTRDLHDLPTSTGLEALISVHLFEAASTKCPKKKPGNQQALQLVTTRIPQTEVVSVITASLHIRDDLVDNLYEDHWRPIVLVGHSISSDIKVLSLLGLDIKSMAPVLTVIDTHSISRWLLPPHHPFLQPLLGQKFTLAGVLAQFKYRPPKSLFHNAANDAKYTLHAMLLLALKSGASCQDELNEMERGNFRRLETAVKWMIEGEKRWNKLYATGRRSLSTIEWAIPLMADGISPLLGTGLQEIGRRHCNGTL